MKAKKTKKAIQSIEAIPVVSKPIYLVLSFVFPFAILGTVFALNKVYPFGDRTILVSDLFSSYYPFYSNLWHKLRTGSLAPWSWIAGGGHDFISLIGTYMGSPLNLLAMLAPYAWLIEALTIALLVKIGLAGLFTAMFLRYAFRRCGPELPVFSSLYALCAYTLGYFIHIQWFDAFALLPLVMMGFMALMNEGRYKLYTASLALLILTNFYQGFFICIFLVIAFLGQCAIQKLNKRDILRRLALTAGCSIIAAGIAAVLLIPSISNVLNTSRGTSSLPAEIGLFDSFFDVLGNFIAFTPPTLVNGLPNLYSGMISLLLLGMFLYSAKVTLREKLVIAGTIAFLLMSINLNVLYLMWNGFRPTLSLPGRFSYLISFVLAVMAYRAYLLTDNMNRRGLLAMGVSASAFLLAAVFGSQERNYIIGSTVLCAIYLLLFYLKGTDKARRARHFITAAVLLVILTELSISSYIAIKNVRLNYKENESIKSNEQVQSILDMRDQSGTDFYRTENVTIFLRSLSSLYNYNGLSIYSNTIYDGLLRFMKGLSYFPSSSGAVSFTYAPTTPLFDAFLNMRYLIVTAGSRPTAFWKIVAETDDLLLLENRYYLPLGFMVDSEITGYAHSSDNDSQISSQNNLFRRATGINADLFTINNFSFPQGNDSGEASVDFTIPHDGILYYFIRSKTDSEAEFFVNGIHIRNINRDSSILTRSNLKQGDRITFVVEDKNISIFTACLNPVIFEQGYALLAQSPLNLTKFTDTEVSGNVTAKKDGILYTSIPGNKNWSVYVDGVKKEILLIDNAMAAVRLSEGTHTVEFRYYNKSFAAGVAISLVSLAVFVVLVCVSRKPKSRTNPTSGAIAR